LWNKTIYWVRNKGRNKFKKVPLETAWVKENINAAVIKAAKQKSMADQKRFVKLPVGLGRPIQTSEAIKKNPQIIYRQHGQDTCVFSSLSSALYYMKYEEIAYQVDEYKKKIMKEMYQTSFENLMGRITEHMIRNTSDYFKKECEIKKISDCEHFNLLEESNRRPNVLYHVVLISQDGGENHSVCVIHNLIFDGNFTNALPLSQDYLNKSCDSVFLGIATGYRYIFKK
jgi:arsenate reductase-like glutaredoxin family protein